MFGVVLTLALSRDLYMILHGNTPEPQLCSVYKNTLRLTDKRAIDNRKDAIWLAQIWSGHCCAFRAYHHLLTPPLILRVWIAVRPPYMEQWLVECPTLWVVHILYNALEGEGWSAICYMRYMSEGGCFCWCYITLCICIRLLGRPFIKTLHSLEGLMIIDSLLNFFLVVFTVRRYALHGLSYRNSVRPSVCLVTLVHCVHTVPSTIMISSPYGSPIILVSGDITIIPKFEGGHPERGRWMRVGWVWNELTIFDQLAAVSPKRYEIRQRSLLITNRKSNTRFRLVPKSTTLVDPEMTLDSNYALHYITLVCFGAHH